MIKSNSSVSRSSLITHASCTSSQELVPRRFLNSQLRKTKLCLDCLLKLMKDLKNPKHLRCITPKLSMFKTIN
jgi:hypothetical protein